jgi:hypothetical protein
MMPLEDPPKLRTWPFLVGDGTLLATAAWIGSKSSHPGSGAALVAIATCVALAAVCGVIPFLANYGRQQDAALDERQRALEALTGTLQTSADQISIAAASLHQLATAATAAPAAASPVPTPSPIPAQLVELHSRVTELQSQVAKLRQGEREEGKRLEASTDQLVRAVGPGGHLETLARELTAVAALLRREAASPAEPPPEPIAKVVPFEPPAPSPDSVPPAPLPLPAPDPVAAPAPPPANTPATTTAELPAPLAEIVAAPPSEPSPTESAPPPPPRKRAPRKSSPVPPSEAAANPPPIPASPAVAPLPDTVEGIPAPVAGATDASVQDADPDAGESALSADGATRVLVTAYIGIGNRLFIRGEGPGLSWERGVPLQFVSIGKWRWETAEATAPIAFKLYKNDELECSALGRCSLAPGRQREFRASF